MSLNFKSYRDTLQSSVPPIVPYLGKYYILFIYYLFSIYFLFFL